MTEKIAQSDIEMLKYFWKEMGDLERWVRFEQIKPQIQQQFPELMKAWEDYKASIKIMNLVTESLC